MANERTEPLQLNLGSLRSAMSLTLHTHHASRIWHGRAPTEGRPGIIGLNGFIGAMNKMKRGAEQDDPYSDWWMLRIGDKIADTKTRLQTLRDQVDQALADVASPELHHRFKCVLSPTLFSPMRIMAVTNSAASHPTTSTASAKTMFGSDVPTMSAVCCQTLPQVSW